MAYSAGQLAVEQMLFGNGGSIIGLKEEPKQVPVSSTKKDHSNCRLSDVTVKIVGGRRIKEAFCYTHNETVGMQ